MKAELHGNNYLFAIKEEELLYKIKHLEGNLELNFVQKGAYGDTGEDSLI